MCLGAVVYSFVYTKAELKLVLGVYDSHSQHPPLGWLPIDSCVALICSFIFCSFSFYFTFCLILFIFHPKNRCCPCMSQRCDSSFYRLPTDLECRVWRVCLTHSEKRKQTATLCVRHKTINPLSSSSCHPGLCYTMDVCVHDLTGAPRTISGKGPFLKKSIMNACVCSWNVVTESPQKMEKCSFGRHFARWY